MILIGNIVNRVITINEEQRRWLTESLENEGGEWTGGNGYVGLSMDDRQDDKSNQSFDTRTHMSKRNALYGDGTTKQSNRAKGLIYQRNYVQEKIKMLKSILSYSKTKNKNDLYIMSNPPSDMQNQFDSFVTTLNGGIVYTNDKNREKGIAQTVDDVIDGCYRQISDGEKLLDALELKYQRFMALDNDDDIAPTYYKGYVPQIREFDEKGGIIPGTGIRYIALFYMNDFNFSDAMKHGNTRPNSKMLSLSQSKYVDKNGKGKHPNDGYRVPAFYDGTNEKPNIAHNFGLDDNGNYDQSLVKSSIAKFISEKALPYAVETLKNEKFTPDYILPAPSSSKYNLYFCQRLQQMTGIKMLSDFFVRNVSNVVIDGEDCVRRMEKDHITSKDITQFQTAIRDIAYTEIFVSTMAPLRRFLNDNWEELHNLVTFTRTGSRELHSFKTMSNFLNTYTFNFLMSYLNRGKKKSYSAEYLISMFKKQEEKNGTNQDERKFNIMMATFKRSRLFNQYSFVLQQVLTNLMKNSEIFEKEGWRISNRYEKFKITKCPESTRPYLKGSNIYVVADKYLTTGENARLQDNMVNSKFLIYDEDIDSGGTLMLLVDALRQLLPNCTDDQILCLVTATKHG